MTAGHSPDLFSGIGALSGRSQNTWGGVRSRELTGRRAAGELDVGSISLALHTGLMPPDSSEPSFIQSA